MGFLDTVNVPAGSTPKTTTLPSGVSSSVRGSFLTGLELPSNPAQAAKIADLQSQEAVAKLNSENANSLKGIVANTVQDFGQRIVNVPIDFAKSLWQTYQSTPSKLAEDINSGAQDINAASEQIGQGGIGNFFKGLLTSAKGVGKAGGRTAGDAAIAIFAPISAAIGAAITATNSQPLLDKAGQVIADASGITDIPAFQKFAMEHPNAGEDFNRILTLFLANGEKGKIDPARMTQDATVLAQKLVGKVKNTSDSAAAPIPGETPAPTAAETARTASETAKPSEITPKASEAPTASDLASKETIPAEQHPLAIEAAKYPTSSDFTKAVTDAKDAVTKASDAAKSGDTSVPQATPAQVAITDALNRWIATPETQAKIQAAATTPTDPTLLTDFYNQVAQTQFKLPAAQRMPIKTSEQIPNTRAVKLDQAAVERKLSQGLSELPTHARISMKQQAQLAIEYANMHPEHALDVALGDQMPPSHILPESIYTALEIKAIREGNTDLIEALTKSKVPTAAGQALKMLDSNDPDSPVKIIRDLNKAKEETFVRRNKKTVEKAKSEEVAKIKAEVKKVASKRQSWEDFIKEVQCNY